MATAPVQALIKRTTEPETSAHDPRTPTVAPMRRKRERPRVALAKGMVASGSEEEQDDDDDDDEGAKSDVHVGSWFEGMVR
jgi:hypothetical protein